MTMLGCLGGHDTEAERVRGVPALRAQEPPPDGDGDPCAFIRKEEVESALGYKLLPGDVQLQSYGSDCYYGADLGGSVVVVPPIPITITQFNDFRNSLSPSAQTVSGVGQDAFFWGSRIYAFERNRQFSIWVNADHFTETHRYALARLAKVGAARLRAQHDVKAMPSPISTHQ